MKTVELFCGTKSFSKVADKKGWTTYTVDNDPQFEATRTASIHDITPQELPNMDILWASPPCQAFSVCTIYRNFKEGVPFSDNAFKAMAMVNHTIMLIKEKNPRYWFIENPRGMLRKVIDKMFKEHGVDYVRHTVSYCQYGDKRMKPTDIWTNLKEFNPKMCKNGAPCHEAAPRGSQGGTQGLANAKTRGMIPPQLFEEIFQTIEKYK